MKKIINCGPYSSIQRMIDDISYFLKDDNKNIISTNIIKDGFYTNEYFNMIIIYEDNK
jgi:hypothetical protein